MDQYLSTGYLCPVNDDIEQRATAIVEADDTEREQAIQLFQWVRDQYAWDMTKIVSASSLLEQDPDRAMSFSKSSLLISLARSLGIPARYNFLTCRMRNEYRGEEEDSIHAPAELYIDGEWITADPTYGPQTKQYREPSSFGEETWESVERSEKKQQLSRPFVWSYNYLLRFVHPDIRRIRQDLDDCRKDG